MMTRREMLAGILTGTAAIALGGGLGRKLSAEPGAGSEAAFSDAFAKLKRWLAVNTARSRINYAGGLRLHTPCVNNAYKGIWPDDFLYPLLVDESLMDAATWAKVVEFITESVVGLEVVPDRIEPDGMPVMQPGGLNKPHAKRMPLHLPAAWVRLLDYGQAMGANIPRKAEWAQLIQRSFDAVPFSCGLAYVDPQSPCVGYGYHDSCAITGFELMSSLALYRGLQRAATLFADVVTPRQKQRWLAQAQGIQDNLHRLWSEEEGAYLAGSKDCPQVNVWANGLAYWLSDPEKRQRIVAWYKANQAKIFLHGCTRQIADDKGWNRELVKVPLGTYMNGGFWSTGTGYVLPAIADQDAFFAKELLEQMMASIEQAGFPEWIAADGKGHGAMGYLAGIAMPALALRSIREKKPLLSYF